eukprot:3232451-Prorocentrum_lima.AAC.1
MDCPAPAADQAWLQRVIGECWPGVLQRADHHHDPRIQQCPSILFADQAKAFERIPWDWTRDVLSGWNAPPWATTAVCGLVCNRSIRTMLAGRLGPPRMLARGLGMGSPLSLFLWVAGYDPLIEALQSAVGTHTPTF